MSRLPLSSTDLQEFIEAREIRAQILPMKTHTPTVEAAALALEVSTDQIIKSLIFILPEAPLLVITSGTGRVDRRKLAALLGLGRKRVKFANADQALEVSGYVVGSMPPFGHRKALTTLVDQSVLELETIYGGGGDIDAMLRLTPAELMRITGAQTADVSQESPQPKVAP